MGHHGKRFDVVVRRLDPALHERHALQANGQPPASATPPRRSRLLYAALLARAFATNALRCPRCATPMDWVAALTDPASIRARLTGSDCLPIRPLSPRSHPERTPMLNGLHRGAGRARVGVALHEGVLQEFPAEEG